MNALTVAAPKLSMLIPRLASDQDGEVVAVARAIGRVLASHRLDWHDLAAGIARDRAPPGVIALRRVADDLCRVADRLSPRERAFLDNAVALLAAFRDLTPKQEKWLRDLHQIDCRGAA